MAENPSRAAQDLRDLRPHRLRRGRPLQRVREPARRRRTPGDLRGYSYDRRDVTGRSLANAYAQTLGTIFTETQKPYEVEIVVAEVGDTAHDDQLYRLTFDGSVGDEHGFVAMGGSAEQITAGLGERWARDGGRRRPAPRRRACSAPRRRTGNGEGPRVLTPSQLEVAVLDREPVRAASSVGSRARRWPTCSASRTTATTPRATPAVTTSG